MALKPVNEHYENKLVCDFCGHIQDEVGVPTEHENEEIIYSCPFCGIGALQFKLVSVEEYVDEEDD